jgi:3-oxoacyl-ACP reductase-like protein/3-oxoacyl-(acyl-carrier-protein) synthase/phosphopantetheinyl transferase (holo-ACP synthase)
VTWRAEHGAREGEAGGAYEAGIAPIFDARKQREYASFWAWAVVDAFALGARGGAGSVSGGAAGGGARGATIPTPAALMLANRACPELVAIARALDAATAAAPRPVIAAAAAAAAAARASFAALLRRAAAPAQVPRAAALLLPAEAAIAPLIVAGFDAGAAAAAARPVFLAAFAPTAPSVTVTPAGRVL